MVSIITFLDFFLISYALWSQFWQMKGYISPRNGKFGFLYVILVGVTALPLISNQNS